MASEVGQVIDDMLSGLEALQRQAQRLPAQHLDASVSGALSPSSLMPSFDQQGLNFLMMAVLESQHDHPCAASARRWISHELDQRAVPLGPLGGRNFADARVSPRMHRSLAAIAGHGAVLAECDAQTMAWLWGGGDPHLLRTTFGRMWPAICLEQDMDRLRIRVPRIPERLPLRFPAATQTNPSAGALPASACVVIDQDNSRAQPATVFWLEDGGLVPDYLCAVTHHAGRWWPVVRPSVD